MVLLGRAVHTGSNTSAKSNGYGDTELGLTTPPIHHISQDIMRHHNASHFGEDPNVKGCEELEHGLLDGDSSSDDEPGNRQPDLHTSSGSDGDSVCDTRLAGSTFVPARIDSDMCRAIGDARRSTTVDNRFIWESRSLVAKKITGSVICDEHFAVPHAFEAPAFDESKLCRTQDQSDDSSWASDNYNGGLADPTSSLEPGDDGQVTAWVNHDEPMVDAGGINIEPLIDDLTRC